MALLDLCNVNSWAKFFIILALFNAIFGFFALNWAWKKSARLRNVNEERENLFPAYRRYDAHKWKLGPLYLKAMTTMGPRFFIAISITCLSFVVGFFGMLGHDRRRPPVGLRQTIIKFFFTNISAGVIWLVGWTTQHHVIKNYDYSEYLGTTTKQNTTKTPSKETTTNENIRSTTVCMAPHQSFIDTLIGVKHYFPMWGAKAELGKIPGLRNVFDALSSFYIQRFAEKERRSEALEKIIQAQSIVLEDERYPRMGIFPEGTQHNGRYILPFKRGAFEGLMPLNPVILQYTGSSMIDPQNDALGFWPQALLHFCHGPYHADVIELPVF